MNNELLDMVGKLRKSYGESKKEMKRVAIITLTRNANYGNVLQNIAMQRVIESLGLTAETVINKTGSSLFCAKKNYAKSMLRWLINYHGERIKSRKSSIFRKFCRKNIKYSSIVYQDGHFTKGEMNINDYDYFIVGSDQVWNPTFGFATDFEFLTFAPHDKRLSYSASFGISDFSQLSDDKVKKIVDGINGLKSVSVREISGQKFINDLCTADCSVHIDPTLLLNQKQWSEFSEKPQSAIPETYIVVYMLGSISDAYQNVIEKLAKVNDAKIVDIMQGEYRFINPAEFVWLIGHAKCVCTDSFHATAFSILFHRRFYLFDRIDNNARQETRLESLCDSIGIMYNQVTINSQEFKLCDKDIDWDKVENNLVIERMKSFDYIKTVLLK